MTTIPVFSSTFPDLWDAALNLKDDLEKSVYSNWETLLSRMDFLSDKDWVESIGVVVPGWEKIATGDNGETAKHTLLVLVCCMNLPEYQLAESHTQCEIEWAALLHDLVKDAKLRRDASHPFLSAAAAAQCLAGLGFEFRLEEKFIAWMDLVKSSLHQVDGEWQHDHTHLPEILGTIRYFWRESTPASRIIKAVMFHQSLPTVNDWPNPVILSDEEIRSYLILDDMDVLGPLMLGDSDAWNLFEPERSPYMDELRGNVEKVREIIAAPINSGVVSERGKHPFKDETAESA